MMKCTGAISKFCLFVCPLLFVTDLFDLIGFCSQFNLLETLEAPAQDKLIQNEKVKGEVYFITLL